MTQPRRILWFVILAAGALLLTPVHVRAQQTCDATRFLAANSWAAFVTIDGHGTGSVTVNQNVYTYSVQQTIQIGPVTLKPAPPYTNTFAGPENVTVAINDQYTVTDTQTNTTSSSFFTANGFTALDFFGGGATLTFGTSPFFCGYAFGAGFYLPTSIANSGPGGTGINVWGPGNIPNMLDLPGTATAPQTAVPFPTSGTLLTGTTEFDAPPFESLIDPSVDVAHWKIHWTFVPNPESLDLAVKIPNYLGWRPSAGRNENDTGITRLTPKGNLLPISAQLVDKNTQQPTSFGPDQITFALVVSHEPGVAMNWPAKANLIQPSPPDMSFQNRDPNLPNLVINPNFTFNADGTQADFFPANPSESNPEVGILLVPYDWGGWATLNVTAMVAGLPIKGHLVIPEVSSATDILLPKRQSNSFIFDQWKVDHGATALADADDSEDSPAGNGQNGDGFTLYEEYRGFYMGCALSTAPVVPEKTGDEDTPGAICKHVEGDPFVKDLFIVSYLSAEQNIGIQKFRDITGLNVHYRGLSQLEVDENRIINFNYSQGPHLTNANTVGQHALYIHWEAGIDASKAIGGPGLPRQVEQVLIAAVDSLLNPEPGPSPADNEFTRTVAHELGHSVSVWHHGEGDTGSVYWYADAKGQVWETKTLDPVKGATGGVAIRVFYEPENPNSASPLSPSALGLLNDCATHDDQCPPKPNGSAEWVGNRACPGTVTQGHQHSGDVACVMRYDHATAYIPMGYPDVRYYSWFTAPEVPGYALTDITAGTGVNDPNMNQTGLGPLSRYGPAYGAAYGDSSSNNQRGNCADQIDVNDLHNTLRRAVVLCPAPPH